MTPAIWIAITVVAFFATGVLGVLFWLLVAADQARGDAHRARLRLDAHEKRLLCVERDAGIDNDAMYSTWRRPGRSG